MGRRLSLRWGELVVETVQQPEIQRMCEADREWVLDCWRRRYGNPSEWPVERAIGDNPRTVGYVAETDEGERVGFGIALVVEIEWVDKTYPYENIRGHVSHRLNGMLYQLAVEKEYEGQGIGSMLTAHRLNWLAEHEIDVQHILSSSWIRPEGATSADILEKFGFEAVEHDPQFFDDLGDRGCPYCETVCECGARLFTREVQD